MKSKMKNYKQILPELRFFVLIVLVGIISGLGAIVFRDLIGLINNLLFYGRFDLHYQVLSHVEPSRWGIGVIFVPVVGAFFVAFLVKNFAPEAKGHGVPEVMDAIHYKRGRIRPIVAVVKAFASSISIGSGGSVGREGPIIQIGAAFGSTLGQWVKVADWQRITLIACGAGGGIAATFNAPFGGVLFALEVMLPEISARTIIPICISVFIATFISCLDSGNSAFIPLTNHAFSAMNGLDVSMFIVMGIFFGLFSALFIRAIYFAEDAFDKLKGSYYFRHMLGMFFVGVSMYLMMHVFGHYYIQGVGYSTVHDVLYSVLTHPGFLLFLALLKLIDTSITLGSGGSGGIFSPLLFIGATFGACYIGAVNLIVPDNHISLTLGALAGMASLVGASTGAPLTAIIMTAELTGDYTIIWPLLGIVTISYAVRRLVMKDSVYTLKLTRRGHVIPDVWHAKVPS